jgi:hypothetical protein
MKIIIALFFAIIVLNMPDKLIKPDLSTENQDQKPLFSFGLIADIQYCDCDPVGTRFYRSSIDKLLEAVISLKIDSPAFVINLGDMIEKDFTSYNSGYLRFENLSYYWKS